jgi:multidrug efflux pump subunit AcrA (membrane-fusion protein)
MSSEQNHDSTQPGHHVSEMATPAPPPVSKKRVVGFLLCALVLAVILAVVGILPRIHAERTLAQDTNDMAIPQVLVVNPKEGAPTQEIVLPGNIQAYEDAPIYSRTDGYLKKWYVDIGGRVKKGQLLAEIESPEVDQQLMQGRADLSTAQANLQLSQTTSARYADLLKTDAVSQQDTDNAVSDTKAKQTMVRSSQANVNRLEQLQSFEKITAPFDGVITARNVDNGQLINSGNASTGSSTGVGNSAAGTSTVNTRELFHIAAIQTLRVFINVPQIYSNDAKPSAVADLTVDQFPGRRFSGKLVRNANAIDLATRTLLVEVDVKNNSGELLPGSYAAVHLKLNTSRPTLLLPVSTLVFRTQGLQVATLGENNRAHLANITIGRDFGTQVEVVSGLTADEKVIDSPPDSLVEGESVRVVAPQTQSNAAPAAERAK